MGAFLVEISPADQREFKRRCVELDAFQGEVAGVLVGLLCDGRLNVSHAKLERLVKRARGISDKEICGTQNAAVYLKVSTPTVRRMIESGRLRAKKNPPIYGGLVFRKKDLDKLVEKMEKQEKLRKK